VITGLSKYEENSESNFIEYIPINTITKLTFSNSNDLRLLMKNYYQKMIKIKFFEKLETNIVDKFNTATMDEE